MVRNIRLSEDAWSRIRTKAAACGVPPAKFIASAADRAAGGDPLADERAAIAALDGALDRA